MIGHWTRHTSKDLRLRLGQNLIPKLKGWMEAVGSSLQPTTGEGQAQGQAQGQGQEGGRGTGQEGGRGRELEKEQVKKAAVAAVAGGVWSGAVGGSAKAEGGKAGPGGQAEAAPPPTGAGSVVSR